MRDTYIRDIQEEQEEQEEEQEEEQKKKKNETETANKIATTQPRTTVIVVQTFETGRRFEEAEYECRYR